MRKIKNFEFFGTKIDLEIDDVNKRAFHGKKEMTDKLVQCHKDLIWG